MPVSRLKAFLKIPSLVSIHHTETCLQVKLSTGSADGYCNQNSSQSMGDMLS
jgi:hypothetical protein